MFVVQLKWFHEVSVNHLGLCINRLDHIVETTFNVHQSRAHCINNVDITLAWMRTILYEVSLKLLVCES